jgi:serine/threonine protein kinase
VFLTDAGSRWGTFVNGVRVSECELVPGDEITIGETTLRLLADAVTHDTTLARPSEVLRPAGLTLKPETPVVPMVIRSGETVNVPELATTPERNSGSDGLPVVSLLPPTEYLATLWAGCHIEEFLCRTGSGLLFRGTRQGRDVAVKLLQPSHFQDARTVARFLRSVEATRGQNHPHVVPLIDGGFFDGIPYAVTEFIRGESAAEMIRRTGVAGMLDWRTTLRIAIDLASALQSLESQGILHRNVTPRHVLVRASDGRAWLNDLLLAKAFDAAFPPLTQAGEIVGDLSYTSPEQIGNGQSIDHRTDIYQLGATLYALLTGRPPIEGARIAEVISGILHDAPAPPTRYHLAIPALFEGTVMTMLAKRPQDRFATAMDLQLALERVQKYAR